MEIQNTAIFLFTDWMLTEWFAMIILYVSRILIEWSLAYTFSAASSALMYIPRNCLPALDENTENQIFVTILSLLAVVLLSLGFLM